MKTEITVSNRTIVRVVVIVAVSVISIYLAVRLHTQLVWMATALFLALAVDPAVARVSRYMPRRNRAMAVVTVLLVLVILLGMAAYAMVPVFGSQMYRLVADLPATYSQFVTNNPGTANFLASTLHIPKRGDQIAQWSSQLINYGGTSVDVVRNVFGGIVSVVTVLILTLFMVLEAPRWSAIFWRLTPEEKRKQWKPLVAQMHGTITGYVNGNLIKSAIAGVAAAIMLLVLGSPDVLALALLVAIFDLIPMVGATLGAILVCLAVLVLLGGPPAIVMAVFFLIFQQIENNLLQPIIFSKTVEVSPLVTIVALIIGATLAGLVGALVAIPVAASIQILARTYVMGRQLSAGKKA